MNIYGIDDTLRDRRYVATSSSTPEWHVPIIRPRMAAANKSTIPLPRAASGHRDNDMMKRISSACAVTMPERFRLNTGRERWPIFVRRHGRINRDEWGKHCRHSRRGDSPAAGKKSVGGLAYSRVVRATYRAIYA